MSTVAPEPQLGPTLAVREEPFDEDEVRTQSRKMANGKAAGPDDIPAEYWKRLTEGSRSLKILTHLVNEIWAQRKIPEDWNLAIVSTIFKKGRTDECGNYRPISLLCTAYKLFAVLLKARLIQAGVEHRLTKSQFSYKSGTGTTDAIFVLRRRIETAIVQRW